MLTDSCRCPRPLHGLPARFARFGRSASPFAVRNDPYTDVQNVVARLDARIVLAGRIEHLEQEAELKKHRRRSSCRSADFVNGRRKTPQCETKLSIMRPTGEENLQRTANAIDSRVSMTGDSSLRASKGGELQAPSTKRRRKTKELGVIARSLADRGRWSSQSLGSRHADEGHFVVELGQCGCEHCIIRASLEASLVKMEQSPTKNPSRAAEDRANVEADRADCVAARCDLEARRWWDRSQNALQKDHLPGGQGWSAVAIKAEAVRSDTFQGAAG